MQGPAETIQFLDGKPSRVFLIPRNPQEPMVTVEVDSHFNFHFANSYDDPQTGEVKREGVGMGSAWLGIHWLMFLFCVCVL